jgi:hypothetical protein
VPILARRKETAGAAISSVKEVLVTKLSLRFALDNLFVIGAAFLAVSAVAFSASVASWLAFGVSTAFTVLAGASVATMRRRSGSGTGWLARWPCGR